MEDRHTILANYEPTGAAAAAADAGVLRSFAGVYDGHNGSQTAEEAAARYNLARPVIGKVCALSQVLRSGKLKEKEKETQSEDHVPSCASGLLQSSEPGP